MFHAFQTLSATDRAKSHGICHPDVVDTNMIVIEYAAIRIHFLKCPCEIRRSGIFDVQSNSVRRENIYIQTWVECIVKTFIATNNRNHVESQK